MLLRVFCLLLVGLVPVPGAPDTFTGVERIVAVGDVHGDYEAFTAILRAAGVIDRDANWTGGKTHLVQCGDILDRGADSRKVMDLLMALEKQARAAGGDVHALIGNHEAMNVYGDLRYVSPGEFAAFRDANSAHLRDMYYQQLVKDAKNKPDDSSRGQWDATHPEGFFEHRAAFAADGVYGRWIRGLNAIVKVNDMVFLHGGLAPKYAKYKIADINRDVRKELADFSRLQGGIVMDTDGPLWYRGLAQGEEAPLAAHVDSVLERLGAKYMVIAHTVTPGMLTPRFDGKVIMIDVGLSKVYGSRRACLIVENGKQYAMHRGTRIELAKNAPDMQRYLAQVAQADRAAQ